jgi:hypothetical protein
MQHLNVQIEAMEMFVLSRTQHSKSYSLIISMPGVGKIPGMKILLESGPDRALCAGG